MTSVSVTSATGYVASIPTTTKPVATATIGVIYDMTASPAIISTGGLNSAPALISVIPWSQSNASTGLGMRITKWHSYRNAANTATWWIPITLFDGTPVYSTGTIPTFGASLPDGTQTYLFTGLSSLGGTPTANIYTPAAVVATSGSTAQVTLDTNGAQIVTIQFVTATTTANMGAFWTGM